MEKAGYLFMLLFLLLFSRCAEDQGNYNYKDINEVVISGIETKYTAITMKKLPIVPTIERTLEKGEGDLEFLWIMYNATMVDTLARTRDLDRVMNGVPGTYSAYYFVRQKETGITYRKAFEIDLQTELSKGILVLSSVNTEAEVTFINDVGTVFPDIYREVNGESVGTNPMCISYSARRPLDYVVVQCKDSRGGVYLSTLNFQKLHTYSDMFYTVPDVIMPQVYNDFMEMPVATANVNPQFLINNDRLHVRQSNVKTTVGTEAYLVESKFSEAYPGDYNISSFMFRGWSSTAFYDTKNKRFMSYVNLNKPILQDVEAFPDGPFDPANVGLDIVWGLYTQSSGVNVYGHGFFKDEADYYYLYFDLAKANKNQASGLGLITPIAKMKLRPAIVDEIKTAVSFAGNSKERFIYYTKGKTIKCYDPVIDNVNLCFDFSTLPGADYTVDFIRWSTRDRNAREMLVGITDNGSIGKYKGSVYVMNVALNGVMTIKAEFKNVSGKIISMDYKLQ